MEIRAKDKIFLALVGPIGLAVAYGWWWRFPTAQQVASLSQALASLVREVDFESEYQAAVHAVASAQATLEEVRREVPPTPRVKGEATASLPQREQQLLAAFRAAGLVVCQSETVPQATKQSQGEAFLREGGGSASPCLRRYRVMGRYPQLQTALSMLAQAEAAAFAVRVAMATDANHWWLEVWE